MKVMSVCSSVGGLDLGLHRAGHQTVGFCEVENWRREILARHWPNILCFDNLETLAASQIPETDLLAGGTPCQDLSVAGERAGLTGNRSSLFWKFAQLRIDLYDQQKTKWSLWENVAGALTSHHGNDFAQVISAHTGANTNVPTGGWRNSGVAYGPWGAAEWRVLDARYFGVPHQRNRLFVVGHFGSPAPALILHRPGNSRQNTRQSKAAPDPYMSVAEKGAIASVSTDYATKKYVKLLPYSSCLTKAAGTPGQGALLILDRRNHTLRWNSPVERERLMGWPDGWCLPDGPSLLNAPQTYGATSASQNDITKRKQATGDGVVAHVAQWIGEGFKNAELLRSADD